MEFQDKHKKLFTVLNYCVFVLLGVFIFCNPLPYTTAITNISFYLAIGIALFLIIFNPSALTFKTPFTYPLVIFFLWCLLSIFWALNVENTINDVRGHLLNHIIFYFLLINFFHSIKRLETLAWIIVLSAAFFSVSGMVYYYVILGNPIQSFRFGGCGMSKGASAELPTNFVGTLTITAIFFCLYFFFRSSSLYRRMVVILCALASFVAIILTQSRATLAAFVIAGGTMLLLRKKTLLPIFLVAIIILIFVTPLKNRMDAFTIKERLKINYVACEVLKDYPLKGIGFGMLTFKNSINKEAYVNKLPQRDRPAEIYGPHNWLLDIAVRVGLIGLILFLAILFVFVKMCWKTIRHARDDGIRRWGIYVAIAFLAYFIMGLAEPLFYYKASAMMFYILLAMITILSNLNREDRTATDQTVGEK
ncbi:hypothetical protein ER57_06870 [Smithella sp. SCADC]|nr:hypothetical protein ER57_06870 [Smithella sp. SCADC]